LREFSIPLIDEANRHYATIAEAALVGNPGISAKHPHGSFKTLCCTKRLRLISHDTGPARVEALEGAWSPQSGVLSFQYGGVTPNLIVLGVSSYLENLLLAGLATASAEADHLLTEAKVCIPPDSVFLLG